MYRKLTAVKYFSFFKKQVFLENSHSKYYVYELFTFRALKLLKSSALFTQRGMGNEFTPQNDNTKLFLNLQHLRNPNAFSPSIVLFNPAFMLFDI